MRSASISRILEPNLQGLISSYYILRLYFSDIQKFSLRQFLRRQREIIAILIFTMTRRIFFSLKINEYFSNLKLYEPTLIHLTRMENLMVKLQDCDGGNLNSNLNLPLNLLENYRHKNNHLVRNLLLTRDYNHLMVSEKKKSNKEIKNLKI